MLFANDLNKPNDRCRVGSRGKGPSDGIDSQLKGDVVSGQIADQHTQHRVEVALASESQVGQVEAPAACHNRRPGSRGTVSTHTVGEGTAVGHPFRTGVLGGLTRCVGLECSKSDRCSLEEPDLDHLVSFRQILEYCFPGIGSCGNAGDEIPLDGQIEVERVASPALRIFSQSLEAKTDSAGLGCKAQSYPAGAFCPSQEILFRRGKEVALFVG